MSVSSTTSWTSRNVTVASDQIVTNWLFGMALMVARHGRNWRSDEVNRFGPLNGRVASVDGHIAADDNTGMATGLSAISGFTRVSAIELRHVA